MIMPNNDNNNNDNNNNDNDNDNDNDDDTSNSTVMIMMIIGPELMPSSPSSAAAAPLAQTMPTAITHNSN